MPSAEPETDDLDPEVAAFYRRTLGTLTEAGIPFLVGGAYALAAYAGIARQTKDLDLFVLPSDCPGVLCLLSARGYRTELTHPHWLGKAYSGEHFVDIIFSSSNGLVPVDEGWLEHAVEAEVLGIAVKLCPIEEMIWSKAFIMERNRSDLADIAHLLRAHARSLDWHRLVARFGSHWRVLLAYLVLFGYLYPSEQKHVPSWVMRDLMGRLERELAHPFAVERVCRGTLFSWSQFLIDVEQWGYGDARLLPHGSMTPEEVARWTAAEK